MEGSSAANNRKGPLNRVIMETYVERFLCLVTFMAFLSNEWLGNPVVWACLLGWAAYTAFNFSGVFNALRGAGLILWVLPLFAVLSATWSVVPLISLRAAVQTLMTVAFSILVARSVRPRTFIAIVFFASGVIILAGLFDNHLQYDETGQPRWAGVFTNKNTLAMCAALFSLAGLSFTWDRNLSFFKRAFCAGCALVGATINLFAWSAATAISLAASMLVICAIATIRSLGASYRKSSATLLLASGFLLAAPILLLSFTFRDELLLLIGKSPSLTGRTVLWDYAFSFIPDNPLVGVGYQAFWFEGNERAEFLVRKMGIGSTFGFHFHNLYLEMAIELGLVGALLAVLTLIAAAIYVLNWARHRPDSVSGFYLAFLVLLVIEENQAVDLFGPFAPLYLLLIVTFIYAKDWTLYDALSSVPTAILSRSVTPEVAAIQRAV
jgi:exopolysaccharide production protein ExoQ